MQSGARMEQKHSPESEMERKAQLGKREPKCIGIDSWIECAD